MVTPKERFLANLRKYPGQLISHGQLIVALDYMDPLSDSEIIEVLAHCGLHTVINFLYGNLPDMLGPDDNMLDGDMPVTYGPSLTAIPAIINLLSTSDANWWFYTAEVSPVVGRKSLYTLLCQVPGLAWSIDYHPVWRDRENLPEELIKERLAVTGVDPHLAWTLFQDHQDSANNFAISLDSFCDTLVALSRASQAVS
jgi:hypothetical protein